MSENHNLNTFAQVARYLELDMLTSQWKKGEKEQVEALIREHGWEKFYAAQLLYWKAADLEKTLFRWTGLLNSFSGLLNKVTPELLQELSTERWRKDHPEEWERIQQESMNSQTQELIERQSNRPQVSEVSIESFMEE